MRFHVISQPFTQATVNDQPWCAFTQKARRFSAMIRSLGHDVFLYASDRTDVPCTELVTCISEKEQRDLFGPPDVIPPFAMEHPGWRRFNYRTIAAIEERYKADDFLCFISGTMGVPIAREFPNCFDVEYGIGYEGVFARYRVFESYAWQAAINGWLTHRDTKNGPNAADGRCYDTVIPSYFPVEEFAPGEGGDYLLFVGRMVSRKGLDIVKEVARRTKMRVVVAGGHADGDYKELRQFAEVIGPVDAAKRTELMRGARALLAPTLYLEPFGAVSAEAQLCGTPVIATNWGAFPETVENGRTGYLCSDVGEFCWAAKNVQDLDRHYIRTRALSLWSMDVVKHRYQRYFERLLDLRGSGFYTERERAPV